MKNLMLFVHPDHDFLPEHKISIKIQIDNQLSLGWKREDIILATNFPFEYNGVKSLIVSDDNFCTFFATFTLVNVIVELFDRKIIKDGEIYWYHDEDAYQLLPITESELDLGEADMALCYKGIKEKWDAGNIFFKSSASDIFHWTKETGYKYQVNEEYCLMALYTNNLLWITDLEVTARVRFEPLYTPAKPMSGRIKTLNLTYMFALDCIEYYAIAQKPLKVIHFHYTNDLYLDSAMYGKNRLKKPLMTKRLIKIFQKHGVVGITNKKMKNLMIYLNPEQRFDDNIEELLRKQIDHSLKLGWKKENLVLVTNFPYHYHGIEAMVVQNKINKSDVILHLLDQEIIQEAELWWYHDLKTFQTHPINSSDIDLEGTPAGFMGPDTGNIFFRKDSKKLFEWIRNRALKLKKDEDQAFLSLISTNYRNINSMYTILKSSIQYSSHLSL